MSIQMWGRLWQGRSPLGDTHQRSRQIIRSTGGIMRGKFPSLKNGRVVHHEGLLELDAIYLFELSPSIQRYREQPAKVFFSDGQCQRRYTPDFELTLTTGELIWIEVKPLRFLREQETSTRLGHVAAHMSAAGRRFEVLADDVLRLEPRQSTARTIWRRLPRVLPSQVCCAVAIARHQASFPMALDAAQAVMAAEQADVYAAMLYGLLTMDFSLSLSGETLIKLREEGDHDWFRISQTRDF